jgi:hypothetical protein
MVDRRSGTDRRDAPRRPVVYLLCADGFVLDVYGSWDLALIAVNTFLNTTGEAWTQTRPNRWIGPRCRVLTIDRREVIGERRHYPRDS